MRRRTAKKRVQFDVYDDPQDVLAKERTEGDFHTEYTGLPGSAAQRTTRQAIPAGVELGIYPPLGGIESPTPQLDWVLQKPDLPFHVFDGDIELAELADCELEALGLSRFMRGSMGRVELDTESPLKKQKTHSTHPIHFWTPHIDLYVDELLRLDGPGGQNVNVCNNLVCQSSLASGGFRCMDCWNADLLCSSCVVSSHLHNPFHRIERWTGECFQRTNLKEMGFRVQLGHANGICEVPVPAFNDDFTIISQNGIIPVSLDYCGCGTAQPKTVQLLRARLFPSTVCDPKTAATFEVLKLFQLLSFNSKISGYEFYQTLARTTDNTGTRTPPDRYPVFLRIVREWRHVQLLKRMGRGHDIAGVKGTKEGECAILCPACPHPGINLPEDWKERPESEQWLYSLFIGIDANFRLKRMNVSSHARDPPLNHGYAYMVETEKFKEYLEIYDEQIPDDKSTCNNHDAIKSASSRRGHGTAASGLGTAECSRHDMKRPIAVGDLQKGERYVNMDYFFLSSIASTLLLRIVVSYDIACQWWVNFVNRCHVYPANAISTLSDLVLVYLVPKFHLPAHIQKCQTSFSFNFTPGVGRTDGESPERGWSAANGVASSTKEMGPGSRNDTLDDHFGDYNWRKIITIASTFIRKAKEAISERQEHVDGFIEFNAALPTETTALWTRNVQDWEKNPSKLNPYAVKKGASVTDTDVRLRLALEDAEALARGQAIPLHDDVSPSMLIFLGLQLEETQRRLALDSSKLGPHSTSLQKSKILERANSLRRRIDAWITVQHLYIPAIASHRARNDSLVTSPIAVQDIKLFLPSDAMSIPCAYQLIKYEFQYRYAQAEETLNGLRGFLMLRSHMYKSKSQHSRGQRQQTRSLTLLSDVEAKIKFTTATYKKAYQALDSLSQPLLETTWRSILRPLEEGDVVGLSSMDDSRSEGRKKLSWIWKVHGTGESADDCTQAGKFEIASSQRFRFLILCLALRVEWCKARARAHRWQEECLLLAEEMRRVLMFYNWSATQWDGRANAVLEHVDIADNESCLVSAGKIAYAKRQARMCRDIVDHCEKEWQGLSGSLTTMSGRNACVMVECH